MRSTRQPVPNLVSRMHGVPKKMPMAKARPYQPSPDMGKITRNNQMSSSDEEYASGEGNAAGLFSDEEGGFVSFFGFLIMKKVVK